MRLYAVNPEFCGNRPDVRGSNNRAILYWKSGEGVTRTFLHIRKVDNAWNQKECFNLTTVSWTEGVPVRVPASFSRTISSWEVDYDSLYVARVFWYVNGTYHYDGDDGNCYFTLQPSE